MTGGASPAQVRDRAVDWLAGDPHPGDRAELADLLSVAEDTGSAGSAAAATDLADRMSGPLAFGTAGLRGPLRAGPNGMNAAVVIRTAAGLATYLREHGGPGPVVVGFDGRHRSPEFADLLGRVLAAAGLRVLLAAAAVPTPLTAFATRSLDAAAGVQVTASHNPAGDNGIKVYLRGGIQLVPPADERIQAAIDAAPAAGSIPTGGTVESWPDGVVGDYLDRAAGVGSGQPAALRVALTPLHGVGGPLAREVLRRIGVGEVHVVASQAEPDPDFPTVPFPNPEEPGACDELLALAERVGADLAVALDPDADRCALGIRDRGGWRMLTGDEAGTLLADHLLAELDRTRHPDPLVATTIVSADLLARVAAAHGARHDETLTGFKWIVRAGDGRGTGLVFGYEEALGICADPDGVRDKDGISAAVLACRLVAALRASGRGVPDALDDLARRHGLFTTGALSFRVDDLARIVAAMRRLRLDPPTDLLGNRVAVGELLPRTDGIVLRAADLRVVIRPSGTEPKLKCYLQVVTAVDPGTPDLSAIRAAAGQRLEALSGRVRELIALD